MATHKIILLLFLGGFIGWLLFGLTSLYVLRSNRAQMDMINEISDDLKKVKQEIKELK